MGHQGPRAALHTIGESDGDAAWIVDRRERYLGLLTITNAQTALRAGIRRIDTAMDYVDREYAAVSPDTTFDGLIPLAMSSDYPIPVTDADNMLVGEVHRSALAEALAETSTADQDYLANVAANAALAADAEQLS
jgi:CBS-domain-containing membrane protein